MPSIREWRCPVCRQSKPVPFLPGDAHWPMDLCPGVPVEVVVTPLTETEVMSEYLPHGAPPRTGRDILAGSPDGRGKHYRAVLVVPMPEEAGDA